MLDYNNGKIYKIVCNETSEVYIGSTAMSLEDRLKRHVINRTCCCKQIIDRNNYYIELLETYPCNSQFELERKEGEYQKLITCINIRIAGRTEREYRHDNKEKLAKYQKDYRQDNKEYLREYKTQYALQNHEASRARDNKVVICECGIKSTHGHLKRHKLTKRHIDLMNKLNLS